MATVANLVVEIAANTKNLDRQLNSAKKSVDNFADSASKSFKALGIGLVSAFSVTKLVGTFNEAIDQIDKMAAAATKLGVSAQAFQKLSFLAEQSDTDIVSLQTAMTRLSKTIGEVSLKGGENARVLASLGLSIRDIVGLSPDQQFLKVAAALGKVSDHTQKVYLGTQLFGRGFAEVLPLIGEDVSKLSQEFDDLGVSLSDSQLKAVDSLDKTEKAIGTLAKGFKQQTAANIAGALDIWLTGLKNVIIETNAVGDASLSVAGAVVKAMSLMTSAVNELDKAWKNVKGSMLAAPIRGLGVLAGAVSIEAQNAIAGLSGNELPFPSNNSETNVSNALDTILNRQGQFDPQFSMGLEKVAQDLKAMSDSLAAGRATTDKTKNSVDAMGKAAQEATEGVKAFNQTLLESSLGKSGVKLDKEEQDFINRLTGFSDLQKPKTDSLIQSNVLSKLQDINTPESNQAVLDIFKAIGARNAAMRDTTGSAGFGLIQDATGRSMQIGTPPKQQVDVNATVKVEVNQNLLSVIDQRIDTKMNTAARGAAK